MNINKAVDKAYEKKTFKEIADAPVDHTARRKRRMQSCSSRHSISRPCATWRT